MSTIASSLFRSIPAAGQTPEFVRWSVDWNCAIREPIGSLRPEATERYLRSLAAIGACVQQGAIFDGVCVVMRDGDFARGCFVNEVAAFYGGLAFCQSQCGECPANISVDCSSINKRPAPGLAGCFGWLVRNDEPVRRLEKLLDEHRRESPMPENFRQTDPPWYGIWSTDKLKGKPLDCLGRIFDRLAQSGDVPADWRRFHEAISRCRTRGLSLAIDFVPAGRVESSIWTIDSHCAECRAPMRDLMRRCQCCGRIGRGHPARHRKVLGHRPFLKLSELVGEERASELCQRLATNKINVLGNCPDTETNAP